MSSIVKAKWITVVNEPLKTSNRDNYEVEKQNISQSYQTQGIIENRTTHDQNVEALREANDLMKNAIKSSEEIKLKSQELGYKDGFSEGYEGGLKQGLKDGMEEGFQEGLMNATAKVGAELQVIQEIAECMNQERQNALDNQKKDLMDIAFEIAKKIMKYQVQEDEDVFLKFFDEVIHGDEEDLKIYLSENQKTLDLHVNKEIAEKLKNLSKKSKVIILKDEDKIVVETNDSVIEMSLPLQLSQLEKAIEQSS